MTSVIVLALMYAFLTFALQGGVHTDKLKSSDNALSYLAQVVSGSALAKSMILAVALSALGSTLASMVLGVRVTFSMGSDGVLPRAFAKTHPKFKTPYLVTIVIAVIAAIGVWLYTCGSLSVQDSFNTIVSVDGLLFALFYALTGIATAVYYRKLAMTGMWNFVHIAVFPLAAAGFLFYIIVRSVEGLGGWTGRDLVMLGIGAAIMLYVRFRGGSDYFSMPRETPVSRHRTSPGHWRGLKDALTCQARAEASLRLSSSVPQPATDQFRGPRPGNVDAAVIASSHRAASKPADSGAGHVGGETGRRGRRRPPWLTVEPVRLVRRTGRRRQAAPAALPLLVMPRAEPLGPHR